MPAVATCPDDATLRRLLLGTLDDIEMEELGRHLLSCQQCAARSDRLNAGDELTVSLGAGATLLPDAHDPLVERLRRELHSLRSVQTSEWAKSPTVSLSSPAEASVASSDASHSRSPSPALPSPAPLFSFLNAAEAADEIGRLGPYRILKVLGQGGMGVVFKAEDTRLGRLCAVKVMLPETAARPGMKERFLREAHTAAQIEHDNIIPIYQVDEDRGVPFIAMPFLKGMSLDDWLQKQSKSATKSASKTSTSGKNQAATFAGGAIPVPVILKLARQIAKGLAAAHDRGLIHRDIKPANIWLDASAGGRVKILDFGLARFAESADQQHLTQSGMIMGTPSHMAPEQARGEKLDRRTDLFSLGVILYRLCTGRLPFAGKDTMSTLMALATCHPPAPHSINQAIPRALSDLVMKLLEKEPRRRVASAQQAIAALAKIEKGLSTDAGESLPMTSVMPVQADSKENEVVLPEVAVGPPLALAPMQPAIPRAIPIAVAPELPRVVVSPSPRRVSSVTKPPHRRIPRIALAAAGAAALLLLAGIVLFWETPQGNVRIEINDPSITARIDALGVDIKQGDKQFIRLEPGQHGLRIKHGKLEFDTDKFVLSRDDTVNLKVELLSGQIRVLADGQEIGAKPLPDNGLAGQLAPSAAPPSPNTPRTGEATPGEWTPLFNGRDLTGWRAIGHQGWRVEGDVLTGESNVGRGWLMSERELSDFELELEYKLSDGGNSGVFLRAWETGDVAGSSFTEVQLLDDTAPQFSHSTAMQSTGAIFNQVAAHPRATAPAGKWHRLEIHVERNFVRVAINGIRTIDHGIIKDTLPGGLGLQLYPGKIEFRNVRVRGLDSGKNASATNKIAQIASADLVLLEGRGVLDLRIGTSTQADIESVLGSASSITPSSGSLGRNHYYPQGICLNLDEHGTLNTIFTRPAFAGKTSKGVRHGDSRARVIELYGKPTREANYIDPVTGPAKVLAFPGIAIFFTAQERVKHVVVSMERAPAGRDGFVSLFNGKDLTGWTSPASPADQWNVEDGTLIGTKTKNATSLLKANMAPAGVTFRTEYQLADGGSGGVAIGLPGNRHVLIEIRTSPNWAGSALMIATGLLSFPGTGWDPNRSYDWWCQYPPRQKPSGEWNTLEISVAAGELVVLVNGKEVNRHSIESIPPLQAAVQSAKPLAAMLLPDLEGRLRFRGMAFKPIAAPPSPPEYFCPTPGIWTPILTNPADFARAPKRGDVRLKDGILDIRSGKYDIPEEWTGEPNVLGIEAPIVGRNMVLRAKVKKLAGTEAGLWTRHVRRGGAGVVVFRQDDGPRLATWGGSDSRTHAPVPARADADGFIDVAIAVIDERAMLFVDGVKAGEGTEDRIMGNIVNIIAFRTEDDPGKEVHFQLKDVRICVLDGTNLTPEQAMEREGEAAPTEPGTPTATRADRDE